MTAFFTIRRDREQVSQKDSQGTDVENHVRSHRDSSSAVNGEVQRTGKRLYFPRFFSKTRDNATRHSSEASTSKADQCSPVLDMCIASHLTGSRRRTARCAVNSLGVLVTGEEGHVGLTDSKPNTRSARFPVRVDRKARSRYRGHQTDRERPTQQALAVWHAPWTDRYYLS